MKTFLTILKVLVIMFWVSLIVGFTGFIFFGDPIRELLNKLPLYVEFKDYMGLTMENFEGFLIFMLVIMIPLTIIVIAASRKLARKNSPIAINAAQETISAKEIVISKPVVEEKIKPIKEEKVKKEKPIKEKKVKPVVIKIKGKPMGLTGIIVNK